jgi:thioredoxin 1
MASKILKITGEEWENKVLKSEKPVLVAFYSDNSGPSKMLMSLVEEIANEYADKLEVVKVEADTNEKFLVEKGIGSIPTLLLLLKSEEKSRLIGFKPKDKIVSLIEEYV